MGADRCRLSAREMSDNPHLACLLIPPSRLPTTSSGQLETARSRILPNPSQLTNVRSVAGLHAGELTSAQIPVGLHAGKLTSAQIPVGSYAGELTSFQSPADCRLANQPVYEPTRRRRLIN